MNADQGSPVQAVVTGAFGYTGRHIARRLLAIGRRVTTFTGRLDRPNPFGDAVRAAPFNFDDPKALVATLRGARTLYNTYWVRFSRGRVTFEQAIENTRTLFTAAEEAGVQRVVHLSVTNPSEDSPLPYFRGKAILERILRESSLSYAIIRPTVIFGAEDILINNIAWLIRRLPFFAIPGSGDYKLQPIFADDLAELAVDSGQRTENLVVDAAGPETFTFDELVRLIAEGLGRKARLVHLPPTAALGLSKCVGYAVGDVVLTPDEVAGLAANLLISQEEPTGKTHLGDWLAENRDTVGLRYASELRRHYRQPARSPPV
jgi:uncharacterized protein YbjT (DUF2867 family)